MEPNPDRPIPLPQVTFEERPMSLKDDRSFNVLNQAGDRIGDVSLAYESRRGTYEIRNVSVIPKQRGQGYGKAIHIAAGARNLHDGKKYILVSSGDLSQGSIGVWESLVRDGLARKVGEFRYEMIEYDPQGS